MGEGACVLLAVVCALLVVTAALGVTLVRYERELARMAAFCARKRVDDNQVICVGLRTEGTLALADAVNALAQGAHEEHARELDRRRAFQRDLAALSHDARTPLAGAQGYLQLYEGASDEVERARCVREAAARLGALRELVDQLFEYVKSSDEDRSLALVDVRVCDVLADELAALFPAFAARGWAPRVELSDEDALVCADEEALRRIFANLAGNCLRHGAGAPTITQGGARGEEISFRNRVEDPSRIDPQLLFARFYRGDVARAGEGSGLGLAIVANLAGRMGARVSARLEADELVLEVRFLPAKA